MRCIAKTPPGLQKIKQLDNYDPKYFCFVPGELTCDHSDFVKLVPVDVRYIFHLCHVGKMLSLDRGSHSCWFTRRRAHVQSTFGNEKCSASRRGEVHQTPYLLFFLVCLWRLASRLKSA